MRNIVLRIRFDGTAYHGWQRQKNALTVQQVMEDTAQIICGQDLVSMTGCSRTDAFVHANDYYCNFKTDCKIPHNRLSAAFNSLLPRDIAVLEGFDAKDDFSTRFNCIGKEYVYKILNTRVHDPFMQNRAWHIPVQLDMEALKEGAKYFVGRHDFSSFMAIGSSIKTTVRNVKYVHVENINHHISICVYADGFLYNMVRIICGTLVYVAKGKIACQDIEGIIASCNRENAGPTAPPQGLYLNKVDYDFGGIKIV